MNELLSRNIPGLLADPHRFLTAPTIIERLSKDFYWYSPVLKKQLDGKYADAVVQPINVEEVRNILRFCYEHDIPVTPRGAGTGNYGQAIPLLGGLVLDLSRMERSSHPCMRAAVSKTPNFTPGSQMATPSAVMDSMRSMRDRSRTRPPSRGIAWP